ncbi:MAG: tetratricopeptide repeat protein [Gemmataceae bacterium]
MPHHDLPATLDSNQGSAPADPAQQMTTAPETDQATKQATTGLDLRGYELLDRLGGGGMGDVYRALDPALGRDLAVKVMKAEIQGYAAAENRFLREARITGSLQHPGIVPIHNLGQLADGRLHYTMRLVRGRTLSEIFREEAGKPERLPPLLSIFEKICQAMAYAHSKQVIHRDLKPANVMVGRFGEVQVMDWGLAKVLTVEEDEPTALDGAVEQECTRMPAEPTQTAEDQTRMGREMGTPAYMPPEQAMGEWGTVDERADVFALGAILCETLTGQPPYGSRESILVALRKAKKGELTEAFARLEGCGAETALVELCRQCLAPVREGRPRNADQVAQRIAAYQAEVQERLRRAELERATAVVKAAGERKKRRWMLTAVLVLLAGAGVSSWLAVRATKAEGEAKTAAEAEREANSLAQTRLGQMEKANEVLTSIFRDLDPRAEDKGGPGLRQQLSKHLQRAAQQLGQAAVGEPLAIARLQTELGKSLLNLGQAKLAIEVLGKAGDTLESQLGPDHLDTLTSRNSLAWAYRSAGVAADAIRLFEQNLKLLETKLGPDHPDTLACRNNLANAYESAGRTKEAILLHEQILKQRESKLGPDHPDTIASRHNLAAAYQSAGRTAESIRLFEQTLKQYEAQLGPDHPDTLSCRNNLANAYQSAGRRAEAIPLFEQTLQQREAKLGPDHPDTLTSRNNLAQAYSSASQSAKAIPLYEKNLKLCEEKLGPDHPLTLGSRNNLASAYDAAGRGAEAIPLLEQTLKRQESRLGPNHPDTLSSRNNLAQAYLHADRTTDAIRLFEQNLKQLESKSGPDHPNTITTRGNLARAYFTVGNHEGSIPLLEATLRWQKEKLGPDHVETLGTMANLGEVYRAAGRTKEAIPLLETVLQRGRQLSGGLPAELAWIKGALIQTYEKTEQLAKAEPLYRDALEQAQLQFGSDDPRTENALTQMGQNLLKQKKFKDAEAPLRQCLKIREKEPADVWSIFTASSMLGDALIGQKKYAEAEPLLLRSYEGVRKHPDSVPPANRPSWLNEVLERLARLYDDWGKKEKAAYCRKKLQEIKTERKKTKL